MTAHSGRLAGKTGIVVGAGQTPGHAIGNGRAAAILFARAGARVLLVDRSLDAAQETADLVKAEGGCAEVIVADWVEREACDRFAARALQLWGAIDFLHNNVGILSTDADPADPGAQELDRVLRVNLTGCVNACQAVLPSMRLQGVGSIVNISSVAAVAPTGQIAYALSKTAMNALSRELAMLNARHGIRVNTVMPGLMDTPMAIEHKSRHEGVDRQELRVKRHALVPLHGGMGSGWDTAWASLYLHSDEARFVTGAVLPVDGGQSSMVGGLMPLVAGDEGVARDAPMNVGQAGGCSV